VNDPDRWHTFDGFDDDAIFADIVAHLNDDLTEVEPAARPPAEDAVSDVEATNEATNAATNAATDKAADEAIDPTADDEASGESPGDQDQWRVNQLPMLPGPVDPLVIPPAQVWRAHEVDHEYEEHFEPPPLAPLPVGDLHFWAIIAGMGGGPLLLLFLVFFSPNAGSYWILTAIAMSIGGFALLVSRLPGHHGDDDDGARL
jgi:hypothetical protein